MFNSPLFDSVFLGLTCVVHVLCHSTAKLCWIFADGAWVCTYIKTAIPGNNVTNTVLTVRYERAYL